MGRIPQVNRLKMETQGSVSMRNTSDKQNKHRRKKARKASLEIQFKGNAELTEQLEWPRIQGFTSEIAPKADPISKQSIFTEIKQGILTNLEDSHADSKSHAGEENPEQHTKVEQKSETDPEATRSDQAVKPIKQHAGNPLLIRQSQDLATSEHVFGENDDSKADNEDLDIQRKEIQQDELKGMSSK